MTTQQNNTLISMMLNGSLVSHFIIDNLIMVHVFDKAFKWIYINQDGSITK